MTTSNITVVISCDIYKVWETISTIENYHTWRSDVSKTDVINEKQFIEYTKDGYATTVAVIVSEPCRQWAFEMENSHVKGQWTCLLAAKGGETEINVTTCVSAKNLFTRPVGQSVFEREYLNKEQTRLVADLKKVLS